MARDTLRLEALPPAMDELTPAEQVRAILHTVLVTADRIHATAMPLRDRLDHASAIYARQMGRTDLAGLFTALDKARKTLHRSTDTVMDLTEAVDQLVAHEVPRTVSNHERT